MNRFIVTVTQCVQVGIEKFKDHSVSCVFDEDDTIKSILDWAEKTGLKGASITDLQFSEYLEQDK